MIERLASAVVEYLEVLADFNFISGGSLRGYI